MTAASASASVQREGQEASASSAPGAKEPAAECPEVEVEAEASDAAWDEAAVEV